MISNGINRFMMSDHSRSRSTLDAGKLLGFFSTRVLRGGPRILLYLATFLVLALIAFKFMPEGLSDMTFGSLSTGLWGWSNQAQYPYGSNKRLRIVVFGADDIAASAQGRRTNGTLGWTEVLCQQLQCSSRLSMVPSTENTDRSMASNELYAAALDRTINQSAILGDQPGYDYGFVPGQYPVPRHMADLSEQVTKFLEMPKAKQAPTETLWVFSLGMWDIWSLAAMPISISVPAVDDMARHVFEQIERLYQSSLDRKSIAWSGANIATASNQAGNATTEEDTTPFFRIIIPKAFDPSMTPGWGTDRPIAPEVHSRAEQMKNAAKLTTMWNKAIQTHLDEWVKKSDQKEASSNEGKEVAVQTAHDATPDALRDAIPYDFSAFILKAIVDRQFRDAGLADHNGIGKEFETTSFLKVWEPCVDLDEYADEQDEERLTKDDEEDDDYSVFPEGLSVNKNPRALPQIRGRSPAPDAELEDDVMLAPSVGGECTAPETYLFYTSFTVSQRAIVEIARQAADMVQQNRTLRKQLAASG